MIREVNTSFYVFDQNNSGGYYIVNNNVAHRVIIEAINEDDAKNKAENIFKEYNEYCDCCGERWDTDMDWIDCYKELPELQPHDYMKIISPNNNEKAIIYYIDGNKALYDLETQEILKIEVNNES